MPKRDPKSGWQPKYSHHKPSGRAYVRIQGEQHYLGPWQSEESLREYDRLISEWRAGVLQKKPNKPGEITFVVDLLLAFMEAHRDYYTKHGKPTAEWYTYKGVVENLESRYGEMPVDNITPQHLVTMRNELLHQEGRLSKRPFTRKWLNRIVARSVRIWQWGVEHGYVSTSTWQALTTITPLRKTRSTARESTKILPVTWEMVRQTMPYLPRVTQHMLRVHRFLGCRCNEVCYMRVGDVVPLGDGWVYRPPRHKRDYTEDAEFVYYWVGPKAKAIIDYHARGRKAGERLFCKVAKRSGNVKPVSPEQYTYQILVACEHAGVKWHPRQLRHLRATEIREAENQAGRHGGEGAQSVLRHTNMRTTEIYAERDQIAKRIQKEMG